MRTNPKKIMNIFYFPKKLKYTEKKIDQNDEKKPRICVLKITDLRISTVFLFKHLMNVSKILNKK